VPLARAGANITILLTDETQQNCPVGRCDRNAPVLGGRSAREARKRSPVAKRLQQLWNDDSGQDIAEYAVMLAVILVIVVGTIRLIGSNANNVFSQVGSAIQ
jgi:Flp pilus assembly pilin Flp